MAVKVSQKVDQEVPTEILATEIVAISQGIKKLRATKLNEKALLILLQHAIPGTIAIKTIKAVIDGLGDLERQYVKKVL
jgi:hypothetical protein